MKTSSLSLFAIPFFAISACTGQDYSNENSDDSYGNSNNSQQQQYENGYGNQNQGQPQNQEQYQGQGQPQNQGQAQYPGQPQNQAYPESNNQQVAQGGENIVMHPMMDPKTNTPFAQVPLPASWKMNQSNQQGAPMITGPNGLKIYGSGFRSFMYSTDPMAQQAYQSQGQKMRQPIGIDNVMRQDITEMAQKNGLTFVRQFPLPQVARNDQSYMNQLYSTGPKNNKMQAVGSDWTDKNGKKLFIALHYMEMNAGGMTTWGYNLQSLEADNSYFETAKSNYINGLSNMQYNQQQINAYNQNETSNLNQSQAAHNQKMHNNQTAFEAQQRNHQETYNSINKSSMDAYNNTNESMDRNQHAYTNYIKGEESVTDPSNGQSYQVEGNSDQYWMNGNGEYVPSNNSTYDPNQDPNLNNENWQEAPVNPYGK